MKKLLILSFICVLFTASGFTFAKQISDNIKLTPLKNSYFTIYIPNSLRGTYEAKIKKDTISIFHKDSKKAGFGGFAFGIRAYKYPADHAVLPGAKKVGELIDKKGELYDIVLKFPTDVQFDYTKGTKVPDAYQTLYNLGNKIEISGTKKNKYIAGKGTKGEDLYKDILKKHVKAVRKKWNSNKLEKENMSYMYNVIAETKNNPMENIGYAYYDVNKDGIDELFIGEIAEGDWKGVVYDIYTMVDRKPVHVVSGGERDRYFVCDDSFICNEYSSGALESGVRVYNLVENSTELFPQVSFKYDEYQNKKQPWFLSYGTDIDNEKWENVTEKAYYERIKTFETYQRFNYTPLSSIKF